MWTAMAQAKAPALQMCYRSIKTSPQEAAKLMYKLDIRQAMCGELCMSILIKTAAGRVATRLGKVLHHPPQTSKPRDEKIRIERGAWYTPVSPGPQPVLEHQIFISASQFLGSIRAHVRQCFCGSGVPSHFRPAGSQPKLPAGMDPMACLASSRSRAQFRQVKGRQDPAQAHLPSSSAAIPRHNTHAALFTRLDAVLDLCHYPIAKVTRSWNAFHFQIQGHMHEASARLSICMVKATRMAS
ncbi:hypothetical protein EJ04DRAFT_101942 [Polyplosphaeria fusca]|uniref:Uncharacterized protein n=1 Tax=Polyplosphaeria fusca TaxID=682080 RepID=A0A9P4QME8_9PLEO|nr:hypothetical protein EJ04DRAFT_101942 [Polyplosphaeria fusca]